MVGFVLGLVKGWKFWAVIVLASTCLAVVHAYNSAIKDAIHERERADAWHKASLQWKSAYKRSETLREQETRSAVYSADRERKQCNQRVADSLKSAAAIRSVVRVQEIQVPGTCVADGVINTDQLRDALGVN